MPNVHGCALMGTFGFSWVPQSYDLFAILMAFDNGRYMGKLLIIDQLNMMGVFF